MDYKKGQWLGLHPDRIVRYSHAEAGTNVQEVDGRVHKIDKELFIDKIITLKVSFNLEHVIKIFDTVPLIAGETYLSISGETFYCHGKCQRKANLEDQQEWVCEGQNGQLHRLKENELVEFYEEKNNE